MIKKFLLIISILASVGLYFEFYHNNTKVDDIGYEYMMR